MKTATSGVRDVINIYYKLSLPFYAHAAPCRSDRVAFSGFNWWGRSEGAYFRDHVSVTYMGRRLNAVQAPNIDKHSGFHTVILLDGFPADGSVERLGKEGGFHRYRYTEGPRDKAWMEAQDRRYLKELAESDKPEYQERFRREMTEGLDLSLEHHRNLKREFAHYLELRAHPAPAPSPAPAPAATPAPAPAPDAGGEGGDGLSASSERARANAARAELKARAAAERARAKKARRALKAERARMREREAEMRREIEAKAAQAAAAAAAQREVKRLRQELARVRGAAAASPVAAGVGVTEVRTADVTLGEKLGEGGFGVVYKATWLGTVYALKQLRMGDLTEVSQAELRREAGLMAGLRHPNLTILYGLMMEVGRYGLLMEYLQGGSLYHLLHTPGAEIPWPRRYRMAHEIAQGLAFLHRKRIVHRDIKSLNVLLDQYQHAKLTDFGLSKIKTESAATTARGGYAGTVAWMAPECFDHPGINDHRSDVYSFGMLLWEIAARKLPYNTAPNQIVVMGWIMRGTKETIPEDTPPGYGALIRRCWEARETRPTAEQLVEALAALRG